MSEQNVEMKIDPIRAKHLVSNLQHISERVTKASKGRNVSITMSIKLVPGEKFGWRLRDTGAVTWILFSNCS